MAKLTSHFRLQALSQSDPLSTNNYAFTSSNIEDIDSYLYRLFAHRHDGTSPSDFTPNSPLSYEIEDSGGSLVGGRTYRYKYSLVDQYGTETAASPELAVPLPSPVSTPATPSLLTISTGGTLLSGTYSYAVSAYVTDNTSETLVGSPSVITLGAGSTHQVYVHFPSLPSGANGFNIYRRAPGETALSYLTSVDIVGGSPTAYADTGLVAENCNRQPASSNQTNSSYSITLLYPGATPAVPDGFTWRIYRTQVAGNYTNSLLASVVEETSEGSGVIVTEVTDTGQSTVTGAPRLETVVIPPFSKIDLLEETEGSLQPGRLIVPHVVYFDYMGFLEEGPGDFIWICPFDTAQIVSAQAGLGANTTDGQSVPATTPVIIDIQKWNGAAWVSIYASTTRRPEIALAAPSSNAIATTSADARKITAGTKLRMNIIQADDDAFNLMVNVKMMVRDGSASTEFEFD